MLGSFNSVYSGKEADNILNLIDPKTPAAKFPHDKLQKSQQSANITKQLRDQLLPLPNFKYQSKPSEINHCILNKQKIYEGHFKDNKPYLEEDSFGTFNYPFVNQLNDPQRSKPITLPINDSFEKLPTQELGNLTKTHRNEDTYGEAGDNLNLCLSVFFDECLKADIHNNFTSTPIQIFSKDVRDDNIIYKRQQQLMIEWRNIKLLKKIENNPTKTNAECFDIIVEMLVKIQIDLPNDFRGIYAYETLSLML
ncbi:putative glycosyl [Golovinomyces cichoracearum]|uniref:Putative glycosyl n=1 Tax=Golovinomyces cichoracearum TaxID=62708 RepID=A0A420I9L6_9PEZI|nr:putative glycosyl [Golovinomyces cichoracearum]